MPDPGDFKNRILCYIANNSRLANAIDLLFRQEIPKNQRKVRSNKNMGLSEPGSSPLRSVKGQFI